MSDIAREDAVELGAAEEQGHLAQTLAPRHIAMIAIGGIIGAGLFVGSSTAISTVGPAAIVSYLFAGIIVLFVMRMLSEMAMAVPGQKSFAEFARLGLGDWAGFLCGWLYWYFWVVVVAIEAIAGAVIIHQWLPALPVWLIGVVLTAVLTAVNLMSARAYGEFEFWFSSLKVAGIIAFIVIAGGYAFGVGAPDGPTFGNLVAHGGFAPFGWGAVLAGVTAVIFSLTGAEIATVAAAESSAGDKVIARMTVTVAVRILIFYVLSVALIVAVMPWTDIRPGYSPFAAALAVIGIPAAETIMNVIVLIAVLSCLNSGLYVTSRIAFALAAHGEAPTGLVKVARNGVPMRAILIASLFSYGALAASVLSPGRVFSFLVNSSGATMVAIYLMIAISQLRLRGRLEREAPERLSIRMWWHPWGTLAAIAAMVAVLAAMALTPALSVQFYASLIVTLAVLIAYLPVRAARIRRGQS